MANIEKARSDAYGDGALRADSVALHSELGGAKAMITDYKKRVKDLWQKETYLLIVFFACLGAYIKLLSFILLPRSEEARSHAQFE